MATDAAKKGEKPKISLLKQAALQIVAGGSAGFVEVCIMHPLDLVKTRLQIQNKRSIGSNVTSTSTATNQVSKLLISCVTIFFSHTHTDYLVKSSKLRFD